MRNKGKLAARLKEGLLASTARWKIIFTSVITNPTTKGNDAWGAYQTEWNDLRTFITSNSIGGGVFISGDLHLGAIDNGVAAGFPEMCVAPANSQKVDTRCSTAAEGIWSEGCFEDPCPGFGLVTILTNPDRLMLQAVDDSGTIRVAYTISDTTAMPPSIVDQPASRTPCRDFRGHYSSIFIAAPIVLLWPWRGGRSQLIETSAEKSSVAT